MQFGIMEGVLSGASRHPVEEAAEAGYDGIEVVVDGPRPADDPVWTPTGRNDIRRRADDEGIEIASLCLGYLNGASITDDDPGVRATAHDSLVRSVDAAVALGADAVLVPFFGSPGLETDARRDRLVKHVRSVAPVAEAAGVTFALENRLSAEGNLDLLDRIDSPAVGVYHDTGNPRSWGDDPAAMIGAYGEAMTRFHVKDLDSDGNWTMLGDGGVDFDAVVDATSAVGYDDWVVVETKDGSEALTRSDAVANLEFLREAFD